MTAHLSTLTLHQLRFGELGGEPLQAARAHLQTCDRCSARLAVQQRERDSFVLQPVPEALREGSGRRPAWARWLRELSPFLVAAAAAAVLFTVVPVLRLATTPPEIEQAVRTKGALPAVEVWVDIGQGPRPIRPGERLQAGDRVQLKYDPRGAAYVALAGRDGAGLVEIYGTFPVAEGGLVAAPFGLMLDATPGDQELFVLTSDRALTPTEVKDALTRRVSGVRVMRSVVPKQEGTR